MKISTTEKAIKDARTILDSTDVHGLIVGLNCHSALVWKSDLGLYVNMFEGGETRSLNQRTVYRALDASERGKKKKAYSADEKQKRRERLAKAREKRHAVTE